MTVSAIRWFGAGRCLVADEESGETFTAARLLPGERATLVRHERAGRRVPVADEILEPSPHRQTAPCGLYERCTGCDLLHVTEAEEQRYKQLTVREVLDRHADIQVDRVETVGSSERGRHRARARYTVARDDHGVRLGLRDFDGAIVDITECPATTNEVRTAMRAVRELLRRGPVASVTAVEVSAGVEGVGVVLHTDGDGHDGEALDALVGSVIGVGGVAAVAVHPLRNGVDVRAGAWPRQVPIGDIELSAAPDAWVQPTPDRAAALYGWAIGLALHHGTRVLDATCGTGGLALAMAPDATEVLGVDANWAAVRSATTSAARLGLVNARFRGGKIQTVAPRLRAAGERFDLTVVNPMRVSLGDACMDDLAALTQGALLYLAPAPRAGAADIAALRGLGFGVRRAAAVNLHPGTSKVLMAVLLSRS